MPNNQESGDVSREERIDSEKLTPEEWEGARRDLEDLADSVASLYRELNQRDEENLNPLIFPEDIATIGRSARELQESVQDKDVNVFGLDVALKTINATIAEIGNVGPR